MPVAGQCVHTWFKKTYAAICILNSLWTLDFENSIFLKLVAGADTEINLSGFCRNLTGLFK